MKDASERLGGGDRRGHRRRHRMVSTPGFDPNIFARGITQSEWRDLLDSPERPLNNKAIDGVYPPGSTYKMVTALAALESKAIDPVDACCPATASSSSGDIKFHCWLKGGHGGLNVVRGDRRSSCDCFFYEAARRAGVDRIAEIGGRLGFGRQSELGLPGESAGIQPSRAWKQEKYGKPWQHGDTFNLGIGQGYMNADAPAARHHDGAHRQRRLRGAAQPAAGQGDAARGAGAAAAARQARPRRRCASTRRTWRSIREGMIDVVNSGVGTANQLRIDRQGQAARAGAPLRRQDRHRPGQAHHRARARHGHHPGARCPGTCATMRCSSASARSTIRAMPAPSSSSTAWRAAPPPARSAATCWSRP